MILRSLSQVITLLYKDATPIHHKIFIRKPIQDVLFNNEEISSLASQLQTAVVKACLENDGNPPLITANFPTRDGYCVVCGDSRTLEWIKKEFHKMFSLADTVLCLVEGKTLNDKHSGTIFVPEPRMDLFVLLQVINKLNPGCQTGNWWICGTKEHPDGSSIIHILVDDEQRKRIEDRNCKIFCGIGIASVRFREESVEKNAPVDTAMDAQDDVLEMDTDIDDVIGHA